MYLYQELLQGWGMCGPPQVGRLQLPSSITTGGTFGEEGAAPSTGLVPSIPQLKAGTLCWIEKLGEGEEVSIG